MIAQQPQGGLGQVSQPPQAKPAAMPQGKPAQKTDQSADADRIAAEQITAQDEPFDVNKEITNLNKGRMQLDAQIQKMQESLAKRTTLPYDPRFMALGVGLAQPTKTGQFVESLGQGMGGFQKATTDEATRQQELGTQNLDLMMKQQQLRQKLAGSAMLQNLSGPQGAMPPQAGGAPLGGLAVPAGGGAPPTAGMPATRPGLPTTVTGFAPIGRRELVAGQQIGDPDTEKFLFNL
jgi:Sec-independent protein translocase protein TatA